MHVWSNSCTICFYLILAPRFGFNELIKQTGVMKASTNRNCDGLPPDLLLIEPGPVTVRDCPLISSCHSEYPSNPKPQWYPQ